MPKLEQNIHIHYTIGAISEKRREWDVFEAMTFCLDISISFLIIMNMNYTISELELDTAFAGALEQIYTTLSAVS